jgi:hypothetical protein
MSSSASGTQIRPTRNFKTYFAPVFLVLEVGCGARRGAERRRIERAAARGEEDEARETSPPVELPR